MWEIMSKGGILMYPLLLCSILALAIIIERSWTLSRLQVNAQELMESIRQSMRRNRIMEAITICERVKNPVGRVLKAGLLKHDRDRRSIEEAMEETARGEIPHLEKYLGILATIASVSPLLGLLGTISGMIKVFMQIQKEAGLVNPAHLAGGIWEALLTTAVGLSIAIPSLVAYNYFTARVNNMVLEMEQNSTELVHILLEGESSHEV